VALGTNVLVGQDAGKLGEEMAKVLGGQAKRGAIPPLWDGQAGERIAAILAGAALHQRRVNDFCP
jgi:UDP-N-acetylglucosamine 2-epimerase (non-hydrolysing)